MVLNDELRPFGVLDGQAFPESCKTEQQQVCDCFGRFTLMDILHLYSLLLLSVLATGMIMISRIHPPIAGTLTFEVRNGILRYSQEPFLTIDL